MFHLTFTGPFAGKPLCHGTIFDKPCSGQNVHAAFASPEILKSPDLCPACYLIWTAEVEPAREEIEWAADALVD